MATLSGRRPIGRRPSPFLDAALRPVWVVLATSGPAAQLEHLVPATAVRVTGDPRRFRDLLLAERPRIAVCCQPPASGRDLELVATERRHRFSMRAVLLTPPEAVADRLAALARGFDDALAWSVPASELVGRLEWHDAHARARPESSPVLRFGQGFELDTAAHELRRGGIVIHLRPKEFGLLALLAAHPGRAYTRTELLDRVWGPVRDGPSRTVDVHVRWLRSKIEADPGRPVHLVTVRGVGYRLDAAPR